MQRRIDRQFDRELLRLAKIRHDREFNYSDGVNRVFIRKAKKQIKLEILEGL